MFSCSCFGDSPNCFLLDGGNFFYIMLLCATYYNGTACKVGVNVGIV